MGVGQCAARGVTVCNPNGNPGAAWRPAGVQQNVPVATVLAGGFRECFRDTYNDSGTPLDAILAGCAGAELVTACRPLGSDVLTLAALGDRAQVIQDTGSPSVDGLSDRGHEHNGVKWYFNNSWSWGFAPAGEPTNLNSCDFNGGGQSAAGQRMCWHTGANTIDGGYRCGDNDLNGNAGWERVVYARDVAPVVICGAQAGLPSPERCNGVDDDCDGQTDESDAIDATLWYQDVDGDLFGGQSALLACVQPRGYVNNNRDCNDAVGAINPNAVEICDSIDNNCNRQIDEGVLNACGVCGPVPAEICNGRDDNCDGNVDNGATCPAGQMCSAGACRQSNVLIVYAVPDPTYEVDVRAKLTNIGAFSRVDDFDAAAGTPTTAQLGGYGAVLVYSDAGFADPATLGNNLATYWDAGGRVVVATFANASVGITGRFGTDANGYTLISAAGQTEPASAGAILKVEPASSLLVGVNTLTATASYSSIGVPVNGAVRVANWPDGRPLVLRGVHAGRPIAGLNFYPPSSTIRADFWAGDGANLMRNALQY